MADRRKGSPDLFLRKPVGSACVRCCRGGAWQARDPGVGSGHRQIASLPWRCLSPPLESPLLCPTCHFGHDGSTERKSPSPQVAARPSLLPRAEGRGSVSLSLWRRAFLRMRHRARHRGFPSGKKDVVPAPLTSSGKEL